MFRMMILKPPSMPSKTPKLQQQFDLNFVNSF